MVDIKKTGVSSSQKTVIKSGSTFGIKILQAVQNMTFPMLDRLLYITKSCQVLRRNYKEENLRFGSNISISIRPGFLVFKIHSYIWLHTTFSLTKLLTRSFDSICGGVEFDLLDLKGFNTIHVQWNLPVLISNRRSAGWYC